MRCLRVWTIIGAFLVTLPGFAESQVELDQEPSVHASQPGGRSLAASGFLELFLPTIGHAYGGDWSRGLVPNLLRVGGAAMIGAFEEEGESPLSFECTGGCVAGMILGVVGTVWAVWSAVETTRDYNETLPGFSHKLTILPTQDGRLLVGLRYFR